MQIFRKYLVAVAILPSLAFAEEEAKPSRWDGWESHVKFGTQTYMNELTPDPGSAGLGGFVIGYRLSDRSVVGASYATAGYEIQYFNGTTDETQVGSLLLTYQYRFRSQKKFQPYLDAGAGIADPIIGYDTGVKGAFTFALGALWKFSHRWAPQSRVGASPGRRTILPMWLNCFLEPRAVPSQSLPTNSRLG